MLKRMWLVRHAESVLCGSGRWQGWLDVPLSDAGRAQASALKESGVLPRDAGVHTSSLRRCTETAQLVYPDATVRTWDELRTRDLGRWAGLTSSQMEVLGGDWYGPFAEGAPPGGETLQTVRCRMNRFLVAALESKHRRIVAFMHGAVIGLMVRDVGEEARILGPCEFAIIDFDELCRGVPVAIPGSDYPPV